MIPVTDNELSFDHYISPERPGVRDALRELWQQRALLPGLARRELLTRYARTRLRAGWLLARPLLQVTVYLIVFLLVLGLRHDSRPYALVLLSGFIAWGPFSETLHSAGKALQLDGDLLRKTLVPRLALPVYRTLLALPEMLLMTSILLGASLYYGHYDFLSWKLLLLPAVMALQLLVILGLSLLANLLFVYRQDLHHLFFVLTGYLLWATPVFYAHEMVPRVLQPLVALNPLAALVALYRFILLGLPLPWHAWLPGTALALGLLWVLLRMYARYQDWFAERL